MSYMYQSNISLVVTAWIIETWLLHVDYSGLPVHCDYKIEQSLKQTPCYCKYCIYRDWSCINQNKYIFEDGGVTRMKHIKNFSNVLNMLHIASRTFIVNNPWLKSNPWPSALQLNYMIHCTTVPLRNKRTIKRIHNTLVHFFNALANAFSFNTFRFCYWFSHLWFNFYCALSYRHRSQV